MPDNEEQNQQPPDFAADHFLEARRQLIEHTGFSEEEVVQQMADLWTSARRRRQQQDGEADPPPPPPDDEALQQRQQPEPALPPAEKRKIPKITEDLMISEERALEPSEYALSRLRKYQYVELWYFTEKGCTEASRLGRPADLDTLTFTCVDSILELQPSRAVAQSKDVIHDQHLSWAEMTAAKNNMIDHMRKCGWSDDYLLPLMKFYLALDTHPIHGRRHGDQALLVYQAEVRRSWHQEMLKGKGHQLFNIAIINREHLKAIEDDLYAQQWEQILTESVPLSLTP